MVVNGSFTISWSTQNYLLKNNREKIGRFFKHGKNETCVSLSGTVYALIGTLVNKSPGTQYNNPQPFHFSTR